MVEVLVGYLGWGAGSLTTDYILSETPYYNGTDRNDTLTVDGAIAHDEYACRLRR